MPRSSGTAYRDTVWRLAPEETQLPATPRMPREIELAGVPRRHRLAKQGEDPQPVTGIDPHQIAPDQHHGPTRRDPPTAAIANR